MSLENYGWGELHTDGQINTDTHRQQGGIISLLTKLGGINNKPK
jgi:hypothetical protein